MNSNVELTEEQVIEQINQEYEDWKAINGPMKIEHISLSELNKYLVENDLEALVEEDFTPEEWKLLNQPDFKPNINKCFGGVAWFLGNWNGDSYFTAFDLLLIKQFINSMPDREWEGSPVNSNALSSSYFDVFYQENFSGGGILNRGDEVVAQKVLIGVYGCNGI